MMINKNREEKKLFKYWILMLVLAMLIIPCVGMKAEAASTCKSAIRYRATTTSRVNLRQEAGTIYKTYGLLDANQEIIIMGWLETDSGTWYKCHAAVNGVTRVGYVSGSYVKLEKQPYAYVSSSIASSLNVRASASSSATVISKLQPKTKVVVLGVTKKNDTYWCHIYTRFMGSIIDGYVMGEYLDIRNVAASAKDIDIYNRYKNALTCDSVINYPATTAAAFNMRVRAGMGYCFAATVPKDSSVKVLGWISNQEGTWCKTKVTVNKKEYTGYIKYSYIKLATKPSGVVDASLTNSLNVRQSYSTTAKVKATISGNANVTVLNLKKSGSTYWYGISTTVNNKTVSGYVMANYIDVGGKASSSEQTGYVNNYVTTTVNVRKGPSTDTEILMSIPRNTTVIILGQTSNWYNVKVTYGGKTVTGYIMMTYITLNVTPGTNDEPEEEPDDETNTNVPTDEAFETLIAKFPSSYQTKLRALHAKYPNWKFVAVQTGLNWADVIEKESVVGRNTIQSNYPKGGNTLAPFSYLSTESGAYNWANDTYIVKDGSNFYSASSEVIAYYMDPRNFLNETDIFQFEALAYDTSQKASVVQSILSNTFMKGNYSVTDSATGKVATGSYRQAFMDAGKKSASSPYFLASRVKQEVGVNGSNSTSGTYSGYEGIYNFYNIGAFDGGDAVAKGLQWAKGGSTGVTTYGRPWTTPYKSIVGGAQYIAKNYINKGQNTLYFQKFNVNPVDDSNLYLHQYMTNVQAPHSEGRTTKSAYSSLGILSDVMVFYIPVYNNMPTNVCSLPKATGNPNPYIYYATLYNGTEKLSGITPTFRYDRFEYTIVVPANVASITINATPVSSRASISGKGTYTLKAAGQTTTIKLTGIAENGARQVYTIKVTRSAQ